MNKKAVFFDIDGTLCDRKGKILESTKEAIKKLRENGHLAFLCSGRSRGYIRNEELLGIGFDGVVAACGTHVDFHKETVFERLLSTEQIAHILAVSKKHGMPVIFEGPEYLYANPGEFSDDPYVVFLRKEMGEKVQVIPDDASGVTANKFSGELLPSFEAFAHDLGAEFELVAHSKERVFEAVPKGFNKATGIKTVCEIFALPLEDTYAFGDSENDLEMLEVVGCGVAMGNGSERVKETADYITTDVNEDGIANGLKHLGLI